MCVGNIREPQAIVEGTKIPLRDRLKLFDATVTPSLRYASGTWTMTKEMKEETPDSAMTDDEDDHTEEENSG